jgi:hypothetical protein
MHKWSGRVAALSQMVERADILPWHKPLSEWPDAAWERLTPEALALLSDEALDRFIAELEEIERD